MSVSVFLDRFEKALAILQLEDGRELQAPRDLLPAGAREGDWLRLSLEPDPDGTAQRRDELAARRARLAAGDDGGDLTL